MYSSHQGLFQRLLKHMSPSSRKEQKRNWSEQPPRWWGRAEAAVAEACEWGPLEPLWVPMEAGASAWGGRLQRWPQSTACLSVVLVFCGGLSFSKSIPGCRAPRCHPLTANSSLLPRPAPHPALVHLRHPMGCAGLWPGTSVWVSLCPARQCLAAALFLEPPSFPSVPADGPAGEGLPQMRDPLLNFTLHQGCSPILLALVSLFLSFFFHPIWLHRNLSCPSCIWGPLLEFSRCSESTFPFVDVFLIHCGERWAPCPPTPLLSC